MDTKKEEEKKKDKDKTAIKSKYYETVRSLVKENCKTIQKTIISNV